MCARSPSLASPHDSLKERRPRRNPQRASLRGISCRAGRAVYYASKLLLSFSEAAPSGELKPQGVRVTVLDRAGADAALQARAGHERPPAAVLMRSAAKRSRARLSRPEEGRPWSFRALPIAGD